MPIRYIREGVDDSINFSPHTTDSNDPAIEMGVHQIEAALGITRMSVGEVHGEYSHNYGDIVIEIEEGREYNNENLPSREVIVAYVTHQIIACNKSIPNIGTDYVLQSYNLAAQRLIGKLYQIKTAGPIEDISQETTESELLIIEQFAISLFRPLSLLSLTSRQYQCLFKDLLYLGELLEKSRASTTSPHALVSQYYEYIAKRYQSSIMS